MSDLVEVPPERPHSGAARVIENLTQLCAIIPYSLVALALRLILARVFFSAGQEMVAGETFTLMGHDVSLPFPLRDDVLRAYETALASENMSSTLIAYAAGLAEFVLPILLVIGLATRVSALALVLLMIVLDCVIAPGAFWSLHIYWYAILVVLMSCGPGKLSVDHLIRRLYER